MTQSSSYAVSPWLSCYTPRPDASLRLFCFPHGGGGPHIYREWADKIPVDIEIYALHLPGRGSRRETPLITDMDELSAGIFDALYHYTDKPYALFGHSVGALIAFEVTRLMRSNGCSLPTRLCVSAHKAPHNSEEKNLMYNLPDDELVEVIGKLGLVPDEALENAELLELILPPIKADFQVSETYRYREDLSLPLPITAMGGRADSLVSEGDLDEWHHYSSVGCHTVLYDGGHFYTQSHQDALLADLTNQFLEDLGNLPRSVMIGEKKSYPEKCLHELFRLQAYQNPDELAVADIHCRLTFRELDEATDLLARLLQNKGVQVDSIVGIYMESSVEFVIAYLGILKAAGAYMPLETAYPKELLQRVMTTAEPVVVLTKKDFADNLPSQWVEEGRVLLMDKGWEDDLRECPLPILDENRNKPTIDSLAYCVMTSGTTGAPKGILCPHRGTVNSYYWRYNHAPYQENEREACNIFLVWEVIRPILQGFPAFIIPDETIYDPRKLVAFLEKYKITRVLFTPSLLEQVLSTDGLELEKRLSNLSIVWLNGEVVPTALQKRFFERLPEVQLLNDYSISECHDVCTHDLADLDPAISPKYAPLGLPMSNVQIYLLDEKLRPVPRGMTAEIYVGGDSLARGYLNQPEKTAERFIPNPLLEGGATLFRTGDLGMILPNGYLEVKGRVEFMVKLRGYSIVLGAVETAIIEHPEINTAVVLTRDNSETGQPESLVAYIVSKSSGKGDSLIKELRTHLKERLPHYAIPSAFVPLQELPLNDVTGKLDRKRLPPPKEDRNITISSYRPAPLSSTLEQAIVDVWQELLEIDIGHPDDNFFDLGGHSLLAIRMSEALAQRLGVAVSVIDTYEHPTVSSLAEHLTQKAADRPLDPVISHHNNLSLLQVPQTKDIAIVGIACRFPGADNVAGFWKNLQQGVCSIRELTDEELVARGIGNEVLIDRDYRKFGALLENVELFEPGFWGLSKKEASLMDPQQRLFLETCYHAMEDAGYAPDRNGARTGVFGGCYSPTYLLYYLQGGGMTDPTDPAEFHLTETGNDKDYIATRVSYLLNLRGPSITVQSSCSTAASVVATACQSLIAGQCDMAVAGASSITFPQGGYQYVEGHINSRDGAVRTFDVGSSGTILGDGVGVVILKRLSDALEDGDTITAVIKGFSVNNDGNAKAGYSAPSVQGQKEMVEQALTMAGVPANSISLLEAHGTGTLIGDPIEVRALTEVFRRTTEEKGFCAIGSVKPNIGHSNIAAGMAGLIKAALCLKEKTLVPLINLSEPNSELNIEKSPFYINTALKSWDLPSQTARRAGVTCLGIGGTNCHFILEEAPTQVKQDHDQPTCQLLTLSARTQKSLDLQRQNLINYLRDNQETELADLSYTLHFGRDSFEHRLAFSCRDNKTAIKKLHSAQNRRATHKRIQPVFLFPGQGSQHLGMGAGLYQEEPVFHRFFDQCADLFRPLINTDLRKVVFTDNRSPDAEHSLSIAYHLQPAIFSLQYSLAKTLMTWGIIPAALIGHSIGEYTAACISGAVNLEDAIKLIVARSMATEEAKEGAMISVSITEDEAVAYLADTSDLSLAVVNSATDMVFAGPVQAITEAEETLRKSNTPCRRVHVTRAFHSPMMNEAAGQLSAAAAEVDFSKPTIPLASNVSGTWMTMEQLEDQDYWATHMKSTVRFADNLNTVLDDSPPLLLEVGSHTILQRLAMKIVGQRQLPESPFVFSCLQHPRDTTPDSESFGDALARMWTHGVAIDWHAFHSDRQGRRIPLPVYPFDGQSCWKDNRTQSSWNTTREPLIQSPAACGQFGKITDISKRGYIPSWTRSLPPLNNEHSGSAHQISWLLFMEDDQEEGTTLSSQLVERLEAAGDTVIQVRQSYHPFNVENGKYFLNPSNPDEYGLLFNTLRQEGNSPQRVIDFWTLTGKEPDRGSTLAGTYYHALYLAKAVSDPKHLETVDIWLVTDKTVQVSQENTNPLKSTLFGPAIVLPQENPHIACRLLDVEISQKDEDAGSNGMVDNLLQEFRVITPDPEPVIAYRGPHRWVQRYEQTVLPPVFGKSGRRMRRGGIYIITGGMGRIGRTLAGHLASLSAKIILTCRGDFPSPCRWQELHDNPQTDPELQKAISRLLELEAAGAELVVIRTDMSKPDEVKRLLQTAVERFGVIDGVFHAAGVANLRYLPEINYDISESEFAPKIQGLYNLQQAVEDCKKITGKSPSFVLLFSSLASILGGYSMTAYTAANRVMDSFAQQFSGGPDPAWISVNWDDWDFAYTKEQVSAYEHTAAKFAMSPAEGIETLERILSMPSITQMLVSTRSLAPRIEQWLHQQTLESAPEKSNLQTGEHEYATGLEVSLPAETMQNCSCNNAKEQPETPPGATVMSHTEDIVLQIYRNQLEYPDMAADDNFFQVGGDSLQASQILMKLRRSLGERGDFLKLSSIFDYPSVRELNDWLRDMHMESSAC
ncbi:type I polyketide synthase [Desulfopila sp. IMCC35008]|uniref:type I polyketide synthase n=1 Tax=Desulfopila sp. IMCC35008 TaxID=2653858 RepID=UPI0013D283B6|nr:type I polyketide synthase [Desulfopila sp. IMCC35008]